MFNNIIDTMIKLTTTVQRQFRLKFSKEKLLFDFVNKFLLQVEELSITENIRLNSSYNFWNDCFLQQKFNFILVSNSLF